MFPRSITKNTPKPHKTAPLSVSTAIPAPPPPPPAQQNSRLTPNGASLTALLLLALTLIPAHHASAQIFDAAAPGNNLTYTIVEDASPNTVTANSLTFGNAVQLQVGVFTAQDTDGMYGNFVVRLGAPLSNTAVLTYTLDNDNAAVDALNDGDTLTETFTVAGEQTSGTTGPVSATVTINIQGETDPPTFGAATIPAQSYTPTTVVNLTLPTATGGQGTVMYAITETLPDGLTFTAATRVLDGTPTTMLSMTTFTYTVTDSDTPPDITELPFTITITDLMPTFGATTTIRPQRYAPDEPISVTLPAATGGTGALTYAINPTPPLPDGLTFTAATQVLDGTPTTDQDETTYTYTATDNDATNPDSVELTFTITIGQFGSERVVQKTLAAFGRAFATGTVGVFEDYLGNTGASANTSHFTIGGHKFELAANTPAQTLDSRVVSVRKPLTRQRTLTLENDGSVVNTPSVSYPQKHKSPSVSYPQKYKSPSVSFPNDRKTGSDSDHVFHRIGNPVEHDPAQPANLADTTTTMSPRDLLMKSAFHFNLNDDASSTSGWSLWARATTTNFDGKPEDDFDLDGDVTSAYLGMDYQTPTGTRLGLAISETSGDVDYDDATDEAQGDLEADLTSILPYIQWQPNDTTTAWAMLGYGEGDAELSTDGDDETTEVDIDMQMIALGISGDLTTYKRSEWSWKASAFAVELESDADEATDLPAVTADSQRLRAAIQGRVPGEITADGAQFTPNWELGLRWDDGDAEQGGGADVGLGFNYTNPVNGLSVQGKTSFLVAHEAEDYEEWEASLQARLDSGVQGRGITFTLEPGWTEDGRSQKMGMDFSNALGKWTKRGLRLELTGERTERDDNDIGHNIRLTGSLRF